MTVSPSRPAALDQVTVIRLPRPHFASVVSHACRKLTGHYLAGEQAERKAFGLLAGRQRGTAIDVTAVFPLLVNLRHDSGHRGAMDEIVGEHAIPSETPLEQRGWIADPAEVMAAERACDEQDWVMFGNYHTHRVPWPHDALRDSCTALDRILATDTCQWTFILSVVDLDRPILRAYYEGRNDNEARIRVLPELDRRP